MRPMRWNWPAWLGFAISVVAFVSYFLVFARFPVTRDVPWANYILFGAGAAFLWAGVRRGPDGTPLRRGNILAWILALLSVSIFGVFSFVVLYATRQLPAAAGSPRTGQKAPEFALRDTDGVQVSLSSLLSTPLDASSPSPSIPRGVLLVFYRGYW